MADDLAPPLAGGRNFRLGTSGGSPIVPVTILGIGAYLAWFGVHYWMSDVKWPSDPIKAVLTGKPIPDNTPVSGGIGLGQAVGNVSTGVGSLTTPLAPIAAGLKAAAAALRNVGAGYNYGGPADRPGNWDCSSFVSKVLGQDMGLSLPGGGRWGDPGYPPHAHGPGSTAYMLYGTGISRGEVQAGDLIVSIEHIGIAINANQMVSAQQPSTGTAVSSFPAGFPSGPPVYRRPPYEQLLGP